MGIDDRLLVAADELKELCEEPVRFDDLRAAAFRFAALLAASERLDDRLSGVVRGATVGLRDPIRRDFLDVYVREALKCAFFLLGIYEATHGYSS